MNFNKMIQAMKVLFGQSTNDLKTDQDSKEIDMVAAPANCVITSKNAVVVPSPAEPFPGAWDKCKVNDDTVGVCGCSKKKK